MENPKYEVEVTIEYDKGLGVRYKANIFVRKDGRALHKYTKLDLPFYTIWGMKRSLLYRISRIIRKASKDKVFNRIEFKGDPRDVKEFIRGL